MSRIILITGTARGIGKKLCEYYLENGDRVFGCSRGESAIVHKQYEHFSLDITDEMAVVMMVRAIHKECGRIDILLNNAAIASMNHALLTPAATVTKVLNTNVGGTFLLMREVGKIMSKTNTGRIVNFSSFVVAMRLEGEAIYVASKAAVEMLTRVFAKELAPFNITVNAVGPSVIQTDMVKNVPSDSLNSLLDRQPLKSFTKVEDIINVINFFIAPESTQVTGQVIYLGGLS
jgi:3-oxoacyl-[acyl-carrier protein] reductase